MNEYLQKFMSAPLDFVWHYILPFVLVLSILVFVHEWGHYIVARICGVRVMTFSIGFGKELFGRTDKHGTRWKFSMVPLGGFVQMFGDTDPASSSAQKEVKEDGKAARGFTAEEKKVAFFSQSVGKRSAIVFAGPAINFLFAIIVLTGLYTFHGKPYTPPIAASLIAGAPAEKVGIKPDDKIIAINGQPIVRFEQIVETVMINLDQEMELTVIRSAGEKGKWLEDKPEIIKITPELIEATDRFGFKHSKGRIGIASAPGMMEFEKHTLPSAFNAALIQTWSLCANTFKALGQMIMGTRNPDELGGILRIGAYAGEFAQAGVISLITFMALLSVNLGLINLFPVPMLDGGHLFFYGIEVIKGRPVGENAQEYAFRAGFVCIMFLMLFATWNDLVQLKVIDYVYNLLS